jgi:hypothetical protein
MMEKGQLKGKRNAKDRTGDKYLRITGGKKYQLEEGEGIVWFPDQCFDPWIRNK